MAKQYKTRPSELLGLGQESTYVAFCFDEAVFHFGTAVEAAMAKAEAKAKTSQAATQARIAVLNRMLNEGTSAREQDEQVPGKKSKTGFRDPASMITKG